MAGGEDAEVTMVERAELRLVEPLDDREDSSVHEPHVGVAVTITDLPDARVVLRVQLLDPIRARNDIVKESDEDAGMQPDVDPVVHFDEHGSRDDERLIGRLDERTARSMIRVAAVQRSVQRARVEDQRHERGFARSSTVRRAVSAHPDAPIARLRGAGR